MNRIISQKKICIVCEGYEEFDYLTRLKECDVWNIIYSVKIKNAQSIDNIFAVYQNEFQNDNYDLIVVYCDTEMPPYNQFKLLNKKINHFHQNDVAKDIVFFANPCTMQIILSHFQKISLSTNSKSKNATLIRKLTGVTEYNAKKSQRAAINAKVDSKNYLTMKENISDLATDSGICPATNFITLLNYLESDDSQWVTRLANKILNDD
ncbi:MAG: hypothetical protein K2K13_06570 [Clostridiales bacterium]|nr:hypothetical protein [Clostridiales bacterium]